MTDVLDAVNAAFNALFYGNGAWFGLLLILGICIGLMVKWKYAPVVLMFPLGFMGVDYLGHDMAYHAVIMFFMIPIMLLVMGKQLK